MVCILILFCFLAQVELMVNLSLWVLLRADGLVEVWAVDRSIAGAVENSAEGVSDPGAKDPQGCQLLTSAWSEICSPPNLLNEVKKQPPALV